MYAIISNGYSNQSFEGNIIKGKNLCDFAMSNLDKAAEYYSRKSKELPDIKLDARTIGSEEDATRFVNIVVGDDANLTRGSISIPEFNYKEILENHDSRALGRIFLNIAKRARAITNSQELEIEIKILEEKLVETKNYAKQMLKIRYIIHANRFNRDAAQIENKINNLKQDLAKEKRIIHNKTKVITDECDNIADWVV